MRVPWLAICVLLITAAPPAASAQANEKIGFVDLRKAVFSSEEGKSAQKRFSELEEAKLSELRPRQESVQKLQDEYENQKYVLSAEALQERRLEITKLRRDLERDFREAEDELQIKQVQLLQPIQKKIAEVVRTVGKENGFTMIVDKSTSGLVYFDEAMDVTDLVIQKLNAK